MVRALGEPYGYVVTVKPLLKDFRQIVFLPFPEMGLMSAKYFLRPSIFAKVGKNAGNFFENADY